MARRSSRMSSSEWRLCRRRSACSRPMCFGGHRRRSDSCGFGRTFGPISPLSGYLSFLFSDDALFLTSMERVQFQQEQVFRILSCAANPTHRPQDGRRT